MAESVCRVKPVQSVLIACSGRGLYTIGAISSQGNRYRSVIPRSEVSFRLPASRSATSSKPPQVTMLTNRS